VGLLYEAENKGQAGAEVLAELPAPPDELTIQLVEGVDRRTDEVDGFISRFAKGWTIDRMPALDRAVLRLGIVELLGSPHVPTAVVLSEWVELASDLSTMDSSRFVNGVLSRVAEEVRPDGADAPPAP
jgi:transcription antitermination protein NusB